MSTIHVNKDNVKQSIVNINNEYPTVFDNLKEANNIFDDMKNYWYGERYQKMLKIWNQVVPNFNDQLKTLSELARVMSGMLKNYTMADTDVVSVKHVEPKKLTAITVKTDKNINIDTVKLTNSNKVVLSKINVAKQSIEKIINIAKKADWKSPAVDTFNSALVKMHTNLMSSIDSIKKAVDENLTATVNEFNKADKANAGK